MSDNKFDVSIAIKKLEHPNIKEALLIANQHSNIEESYVGNYTKIIATFDRDHHSELLKFCNLTSEFILYILINGKVRPFTRELWLPLLWFNQ